MRVRGVPSIALAAALGLVCVSNPVRAGDQYKCSIIKAVPTTPPTATTLFKTGGSLTIKPSSKDNDGGAVFQLVLKNIDCPPFNDKGKSGKCGVKGSPIMDHVMSTSSFAIGADSIDVAGVKYQIQQGTAVFQGTGKNKIGGGLLGPIVGLVFDHAFGVGAIKFHEPGSDPAACDNVPLAPGNHCTDGAIYAVAGIPWGNDASLHCGGDNSKCGTTAICSGASDTCVPQSCTQDIECDQEGTGNGGTHQCGSNGQCCDPNIDSTCAAQVP